MLEQYVALRDQYPDYLLLFQVGDFYEAFGEDAERLARLASITLTHKTSKDFSTPMAGVPVRAVDAFVERLLSLGLKVALADQVEEPGAGLVDRKVTQLLSPGTLVEERLLPADENYLAAIASGDGYALALLDLSTGEFRCAAFGSRAALYDELGRHRPAEVLLAPEFQENEALLAEFRARFPVMLSQASFEPDVCERELAQTLGHTPPDLDSVALRRACGAALGYARFALQGRLEMITRVQRFDPSAHLNLPESAAAALEVFRPNSPGGPTLLSALSETRTAAGRRRLRAWLRAPLLDETTIRARQEAVATLVAQPDRRERLRSALYRAHDLERLTARISTLRAVPREVAALARTLELLPEIAGVLEGLGGTLGGLRERLSGLSDLPALIRAALVDEPPIKIGEGGLIRDGFDARLDELRAEAIRHRQWLADLEAHERARTGIPSLKVGFNSVTGYYLEVTRAHQGRVPDDYHQIGTLKNALRFTRPDVREREREILRAETQATALEAEVFSRLREQLCQHADALSRVAGALGDLDVLCCLAEVAATRGWVRPQTVSGELSLKQARHPVVQQALGDRFVPNDAELHPERRLLILTGPNMAGKSTYLRTVALCALLHQIGSFVPADAARMCVFDAIHTRIGASDDLAGGRSTFMVEMSELASILHGATPRSLVILDEIGRGTSTYDGLAIAWAALEHLHRTGAFTLFATHYFELTRLEGQLGGVVNLHVAALEEAGGLTFYHQVVEGPASRSYGIGVAKLAGLPPRVTTRAAQLLAGLQAREEGAGDAVLGELESLDLARMTPLEALQRLHELQQRLRAVAPQEILP